MSLDVTALTIKGERLGMPAIRKLTAEEVQAIRQGKKVREPNRRQQVAVEYDAFLADMAPGALRRLTWQRTRSG